MSGSMLIIFEYIILRSYTYMSKSYRKEVSTKCANKDICPPKDILENIFEYYAYVVLKNIILFEGDFSPSKYNKEKDVSHGDDQSPHDNEYEK
jgi:hypothetical protein